MTKTEILEKIDKGLRGQGNQVDIGNVLADVLTEIVDGGPTLTITGIETESNLTKAQFSQVLGITETEVDNLFRGDYKTVILKQTDSLVVMPLVIARFLGSGSAELIFGGQDDNYGLSLYVHYGASTGNYRVAFAEV